MTDDPKPAKRHQSAGNRSNPADRPREKYPAIPLPQRRKGWRPEIAEPATERRWVRNTLLATTWLIVLILATGAALRIFLHDRAFPLVWWNSFTLYVYLPAYLGLAVAIVLRRWRLTVVAGLIVACHLAWIAPDFLPRGFPADPAGDSAATGRHSEHRLRMYYQNVHGDSDDYAQRFASMREHDPDVIALVEYDPGWEAAAHKTAAFEEYPYNTLRENPQRQQVVIFSKLPLKDIEYRYVLGRRLAVAATVHLDGHPFRLFCLHAPRPRPEYGAQYRRYARDVIDWISRAEGPCVVTGDFNATQHAAWYQQLLARADLHSAHRDVGRGYAVTWPNGRALLPPIRIDHVLLSAEFVCRSIWEGGGGLSDHKPLICDIRLLSPDEENDAANGATDDSSPAK